ncbi:hypothetical protein RZA67_09820 [Stenotrophomonas sp. C3(2023)]|uniref:hypothetical protein n=1 Tax=Stenotrophomonas sp. C3(2023) TaxID=3080277 RepID=UPI00293CB023|nr:hypothetical protein [Stenotrophomonas sp. C3(2023)]MDV3469026.1 hypothetical protein [Stenotrophomonas sp. C3(2023)]
MSLLPSPSTFWAALSAWAALWSALASLLSAIGTFAAAATALFIWRSDTAARQRDRRADARALARHLMGEVQTICSLTHTLVTSELAQPANRDKVVARFTEDPAGLVQRIAIGERLISPRFERLSEKLGILPAVTTDAVTLFTSSALGLGNMIKALRGYPKTDAESIDEVLYIIRTVHEDAVALHVALAEATGIGKDRLEILKAGLRSIP